MKPPAEILDALGKPFPKSAIKKRQGGGGKMLDYIETHTVIHRLNSATNGDWTWIPKSAEWRADLLIVMGELTIPGLGTRGAYGVQKVSDRGGEDLVKGANSDALKKAATMFGVGLELYGSDYEANVSVQAARMAPNAPRAANPTVDTPAHTPDRTDVMKRLHAAGKDAGLEHIDLHNLIVAKGHESMTTAPLEALVELGKAIKADPAKLKGWLAKQQELMPTPDEVPDPARHTA